MSTPLIPVELTVIRLAARVTELERECAEITSVVEKWFILHQRAIDRVAAYQEEVIALRARLSRPKRVGGRRGEAARKGVAK